MTYTKAAFTKPIPVGDLPVATSSSEGIVQPDNATIMISAGVISSTGGGGAAAFGYVTKTANYTILTTDSGIAADGTSAGVQLTFPTAVASTQLIATKAIDVTHPVTLIPHAGQTLEGLSSLTLGVVGQVLLWLSDGSNWRIAGSYMPSPLTGKGDLPVGLAGGTVTRQPVGSDGTALLADSAQTTGVRWGSAHQAEPVILAVSAGVPDFVVLGGDIVLL